MRGLPHGQKQQDSDGASALIRDESCCKSDQERSRVKMLRGAGSEPVTECWSPPRLGVRCSPLKTVTECLGVGTKQTNTPHSRCLRPGTVLPGERVTPSALGSEVTMVHRSLGVLLYSGI